MLRPVVAFMGLSAVLACGAAHSAGLATEPEKQATELQLQSAFHTRSPWRLVVREGLATRDVWDQPAPGALTLCLEQTPKGTCIDGPVRPRGDERKAASGAGLEPHYLIVAKVVQPQHAGSRPLLQIVTGSLYAANGDQAVTTQLVVFDAAHQGFRRVFEKTTARNNNQEIRLILKGPLSGKVISAEPQQQRPYGYWISVFERDGAGAYRQILRYPSATRYNDGNTLAVIDSEMPNVQGRLGLWKAGRPLPTPDRNGSATPCPHPSLRGHELWCGSPAGRS